MDPRTSGTQSRRLMDYWKAVNNQMTLYKLIHLLQTENISVSKDKKAHAPQ